jgi:hypothetical protein
MKRSIGTYTQAWERGETQAKAKERAGDCCETCGKKYYTGALFSCHHIDMNRSNDHPDNIVFLCNRCHLECHRVSWTPGDILPLKWRKNIPQWIVGRNLPYIPNPQIPMFE